MRGVSMKYEQEDGKQAQAALTVLACLHGAGKTWPSLAKASVKAPPSMQGLPWYHLQPNAPLGHCVGTLPHQARGSTKPPSHSVQLQRSGSRRSSTPTSEQPSRAPAHSVSAAATAATGASGISIVATPRPRKLARLRGCSKCTLNQRGRWLACIVWPPESQQRLHASMGSASCCAHCFDSPVWWCRPQPLLGGSGPSLIRAPGCLDGAAVTAAHRQAADSQHG